MIGTRKILKECDKIFEQLEKPHSYIIFEEQVEQLSDWRNLTAIQVSLQSALHENCSTMSFQSEDDKLSYCRFCCVMQCVDTVRNQAKLFSPSFCDHLSRQSMIFTGCHLGGAGQGGDRMLQWLCKMHPDLLLHMNQSELQFVWNSCAGFKKMDTSALEGARIAMPKCGQLTTILEQLGEEDIDDSSVKNDDGIFCAEWGGIDTASMILNLLSTSLCTINYHVVSPNANHHARQLKADGSFGATLIGASSFSAFFAAFCCSLWCTGSSFKPALIFSTVCPLLGNIPCSLAISYESMAMAMVGRILCRFGSAEVLNRQLTSTCVDFNGMTKACALFVAAGAIGMSVGPLLAAILDIMSGRDMDIDIKFSLMPAGGMTHNHITVPGFLMSALWLFQLLGLLLLFREPGRINGRKGAGNIDSFGG